MQPKLLIVNLEDNRNDSELIQETLASEGIACEIVRVETRDAFLAAIGAAGVDLILADYSLPVFDGLSALALARSYCPAVPFVFVTGTMGEEIAVEALKRGATDYVLKQHLARLSPVIHRALREAAEHRERKHAEERIQTALAEKEALLRELYHRTRNNMQVICAIMSLQVANHPETPLAEFVEAIEQKIYAMSLVHQMLYEAHDLSRINLQVYLRDLSECLVQRDPRAGDRLTLRLDLAPVLVLIDTALPCGLLLNELMSNALKHAFPETRAGEIHLRLYKTATGEIEFYFADNGVGVPADFDFRAQTTLGLHTIFAIADYQLQAAIHFTTPPGVACVLRFTDNLYTARV